MVSYQNYVLARMPEVWGADAAVFDPYRWFKENGESVSYSPFSEAQVALGRRVSTDVMQNITLGTQGREVAWDAHSLHMRGSLFARLFFSGST